jgi:hypothetical protein
MKQKIFICECYSYCHQAIFWYDEEYKSLYVTIHLITHRNFFKRIWTAIQYIFGYKSNVGDWDEFIFKPEDEKKLRSYLNRVKKDTSIYKI